MLFNISNMTIQYNESISSLIDIFSALLTPMIAILTGMIAYLQWKTNERKRKQDLFEMRYDNLYLPIYTCTKHIQEIKETKLSLEEKGAKIQDETQKFWFKFCKYKFLITNEDSERLSQHYNYILEIFQKYNYQNQNSEANAEEILSIIALIYHLMKMEEILTRYLKIESDSMFYILKCKFNNLRNNIFPKKQKTDASLITENNSDIKGGANE